MALTIAIGLVYAIGAIATCIGLDHLFDAEPTELLSACMSLFWPLILAAAIPFAAFAIMAGIVVFAAYPVRWIANAIS
jgi:hypothetical protein